MLPKYYTWELVLYHVQVFAFNGQTELNSVIK